MVGIGGGPNTIPTAVVARASQDTRLPPSRDFLGAARLIDARQLTEEGARPRVRRVVACFRTATRRHRTPSLLNSPFHLRAWKAAVDQGRSKAGAVAGAVTGGPPRSFQMSSKRASSLSSLVSVQLTLTAPLGIGPSPVFYRIGSKLVQRQRKRACDVAGNDGVGAAHIEARRSRRHQGFQGFRNQLVQRCAHEATGGDQINRVSHRGKTAGQELPRIYRHRACGEPID